ncbi:MAG: helix-turn-helix domain-containing protein [Cyanophyceae cyanobacterium]
MALAKHFGCTRWLWNPP